MKTHSLVISVSSLVLFAVTGTVGQKMAWSEAHAAVVATTQEVTPEAAAVTEEKSPAVEEVSPEAPQDVPTEAAVDAGKAPGPEEPEAASTAEQKPVVPTASPATAAETEPAKEAVEAGKPPLPRRVRPRGRYEMTDQDWDVYRAKREENLLKRAEEREARIAERHEYLRKRAAEGDSYLTEHWDEMLEEAKKRREKMLEESQARQQKLLKQHDEMAKRARDRQLQIAGLREKLDTMSPEERRVYVEAHPDLLTDILGEAGDESRSFRPAPAEPMGSYPSPYRFDPFDDAPYPYDSGPYPYDSGPYRYGYRGYPVPPGY